MITQDQIKDLKERLGKISACLDIPAKRDTVAQLQKKTGPRFLG